jgi:hypothetical protein
VTDESTAPATDESTAGETAAASAPELTTEEQAKAAKVAKRKAYAKERRERVKAEQEAAGLILKREYTTADGATFKTKREAANHIAVLKFRELVASNPLNDNNGYAVDPGTISDWLRTHKDAVSSYLRLLKD